MIVIEYAPPFGPDDSYWRMWQAIWHPWSGGIINIEYRIRPEPVTEVSFVHCPADWCAAPYPYLDRQRQYGLGCVKFSADLIARHPRLWEQVGDHSLVGHPRRHWCTLDALSYTYLRMRGEPRCEDHSPVGKLGQPSKSSGHGCYTVP